MSGGVGGLRGWLGRAGFDPARAQAAFDRQHEVDELGTRVHLALACAACFSIGLFISAMEVALAILAVFWLVRAHNTWRTWASLLAQPVMLGLLVYLAWLAVSVAWSPEPSRGWREVGQMSRLLWVPMLLWAVLDRRGWLIGALAAGFVAGHGAQLVHAIATAVEIPALRFDRLPGRNSGWWSPAVSGTMLMVPLGLHAGAAAFGRGRWRLLGLAGMVVTWLGLLATGSRGGWLAGLALTGVMLALALWRARGSGRRLSRRGWGGVVGAGLVVMVGLAGVWPTVSERAEAGWRETRAALVEGAYISDTGMRIYMARWAWSALLERPIGGHGAGSFRSISVASVEAMGDDPSHVFFHNHAHNAALQIGATTGVVGLTLAGLVVIAIGRATIRPREGAAREPVRAWAGETGYGGGAALAVLGLLLVSAFDAVHLNAQSATLVGACLALTTGWRPRGAGDRQRAQWSEG